MRRRTIKIRTPEEIMACQHLMDLLLKFKLLSVEMYKSAMIEIWAASVFMHLPGGSKHNV